MNYAEFRELLEANFKKVSIYGQKVYPISNIFQISGAGEPLEVTEYCMEKTEKEFSFVDSNKKEALYFVALASNNLIQNPKLGSYLTDVSETVFKQKDSVIKFLENALREKEKIETGFAKELKTKSEELNAMDEKVAELKKIKEELIKYAKNKNLEIAGLKESRIGFEKNIETRDAQLKEAHELINNQELEIARQAQLISEGKFALALLSKELNDIKKSMSWRFSQVAEKIIFTLLPEGSKPRNLYMASIKKSQNAFNSEDKKLSAGKKFKKLIFKKFANPEVSIIIPVYNNWDYTYNCLLSVLINTSNVDYEIIVADDCSTDETKDIKKIVKNVKVIRNDKNLGFLKNCNNAVDFSDSKYVIFLNNDTKVPKDSISYLLETIKRDNRIGAVGAKIIFPDGSLQEAGSIVWKDSSKGYGRGEIR